MKILKIVKQSFVKLYVLVVMLGIASTTANIGMLAIINGIIAGRRPSVLAGHEELGFVVLLLVSLVSSRLLGKTLVRITNDTLLGVELSMLHDLSYCAYESFLALGKERVYTVTEDIQTLRSLPSVLVGIFNSSIIIICGVTYLLIVSYQGALVTIALIVGVGYWYKSRNVRLVPLLLRLRDNREQYYHFLQDLLDGFKEVKQSSSRTHNIYHKAIKPNREQGKDLRVTMAGKYLGNELFANYAWYVVLAVAVFVFPTLLQFSIAQVTEFTITILYIMAPIGTLLESIPQVEHAKVAIDRIEEVEKRVRARFVPPAQPRVARAGESFRRLTLKDIAYHYHDQNQNCTFTLGPVDLEINRGDIVFIMGGNGSGKTTFLNILTGIVQPHGGEVYFNETRIEDNTQAFYRDQFSTVFASCHLFAENYNHFTFEEVKEQYKAYLDMMDLSGVAGLDEGLTAGKDKLSSGQQKRMALILALLENRDIIVLDEWAAEQDPVFRKLFYLQMLPRWKAQGKTVIAITHDDAYYAGASRMVKFEYGKVVAQDEALQT